MPRIAKTTKGAKDAPEVNQNMVAGDEIKVGFENNDQPETKTSESPSDLTGKRIRKPPVKFESEPIRGKKTVATKRVVKASASTNFNEKEKNNDNVKKATVGRKRKAVENQSDDIEKTNKTHDSDKSDKKRKGQVTSKNTDDSKDSKNSKETKHEKELTEKKNVKKKGKKSADDVDDNVSDIDVKDKKSIVKNGKKKSPLKAETSLENIQETEEEEKEEEEDSDKTEEEIELEKPSSNQKEKSKSTRGRSAKKRLVEDMDEQTNEKNSADEISDDNKLEAQQKKVRKTIKAKDGKIEKEAELKEKTQNGKKSKKNKPSDSETIRIASWNVAGIRACFAKQDTIDLLMEEKPDILCLQEVKAEKEQINDEMTEDLSSFHCYWFAPSGERKGYAGVAVYSRFEPVSVTYGLEHEEYDKEGRVLTLEFENFYLINVYVPNAGMGLKRLDYKLEWDKYFLDYICELDNLKPVVICGDFNVSHKEIDLANPKTNVKNAGFTPQEREDFTNLLDKGFVDTFRELYPDKKDVYTFWSNRSNARSRNVGWRLDYFVVSQRLKEKFEDSIVLSDIKGSDHCPIMLILNINL